MSTPPHAAQPVLEQALEPVLERAAPPVLGRPGLPTAVSAALPMLERPGQLAFLRIVKFGATSRLSWRPGLLRAVHEFAWTRCCAYCGQRCSQDRGPVAGVGCGSAGMEVTHEDASYECAHTGHALSICALLVLTRMRAPLPPRSTLRQFSTEVPNPGLRHWLLEGYTDTLPQDCHESSDRRKVTARIVTASI